MESARQIHRALRPALPRLQQDRPPCRFRRIPQSFSRCPTVSRPLSSSTHPPLQHRSLLRKRTLPSLQAYSPQVRWHASAGEAESAPAAAPSTTTSVSAAVESKPPPTNVPAYELQFTCKPCSHRSTHRVSKQGYLRGTTIITCPGCKARHLISDHLGVSSTRY